LLLTNGSINNLERDAAIFSAAKNSQTEIMELLGANRQISAQQTIFLLLSCFVSRKTRKAVVRRLFYMDPCERLFLGIFVVEITLIFGMVIYGINLFRQERKD
jgi:hypothetical protein